MAAAVYSFSIPKVSVVGALDPHLNLSKMVPVVSSVEEDDMLAIYQLVITQCLF
jgi:hypothetical protein